MNQFKSKGIKMERVNVYKTEDGKSFNNKKDADWHEKKLKAFKALNDWTDSFSPDRRLTVEDSLSLYLKLHQHLKGKRAGSEKAD